MNIDYEKLIPQKISDDSAFHISYFLYNLCAAFDVAHISKVIQYEQSIINRQQTNLSGANS